MGLTSQQITEIRQEMTELLIKAGYKCLNGFGKPLWRNREGRDITDMEVFSCSTIEELKQLLEKAA